MTFNLFVRLLELEKLQRVVITVLW